MLLPLEDNFPVAMTMAVLAQIVGLFEDRETIDRVDPLESESLVVEEQMVVPIGSRTKSAHGDL